MAPLRGCGEGGVSSKLLFTFAKKKHDQDDVRAKGGEMAPSTVCGGAPPCVGTKANTKRNRRQPILLTHVHALALKPPPCRSTRAAHVRTSSRTSLGAAT